MKSFVVIAALCAVIAGATAYGKFVVEKRKLKFVLVLIEEFITSEIDSLRNVIILQLFAFKFIIIYDLFEISQTSWF